MKGLGVSRVDAFRIRRRCRIIRLRRLSSSKEDTMGARAEALAKQFETKAKDATAVLERLSEADWKKTTATEKWPVGVVAHHAAGGYEAIVGIVKTRAERKPGPNLPM